MSPTFTKGLLKGAALAVAGAAALGAGSASAFTCSIGSLGSCSGTLGNFNVTSASVTGIGSATGDVVFSLSGSDLRANFGGGNLSPSGSFTLNLGAVSGILTGYNSAGIIQLGGTTGTTSFSGTNVTLNNGTFATTPLSGAISPPVSSGSYTFAWDNANPTNGVEGFRTQFSSDVPVPLPVVGAGLAFGFTRKLRKKAKSLA